jgi:hypothetical protein
MMTSLETTLFIVRRFSLLKNQEEKAVSVEK